MLLADVAHVEGALHRDLVRLDRGRRDGVAALLLQLLEHLLDVVERRVGELHQVRADVVVAQIENSMPNAENTPGAPGR
jgi:hypothetical protein